MPGTAEAVKNPSRTSTPSRSGRSPVRRAQRGHGRPGAERPRRRAGEHRAEVRQAIADLDRQRTQLRLAGRTFMVDIVMQAPERFTTAVRAALEAELPSLRPAVIRSRFHFRETGPSPRSSPLDRIAPPRLPGRDPQGAGRARDRRRPCGGWPRPASRS